MNKKNVLVYGTFDLFHYGHLELLKKSKELANKMGGKLIVAASSDRWAKESGKNVIINECERIEIIKSIKYVDKAFINDKKCEDRLLDVIENDVAIVIIDEKHKKHYEYLNNICCVMSFERTKGISTSEIKKRIKNG